MSFLLFPHIIDNAAVHMRCFGNQQWLQRSPFSPEPQQQQQQDMQRVQQEAWAARNNATGDSTTGRPNNDCRDERNHPETHSNDDNDGSRIRNSNPESDSNSESESDSTLADSTNIETTATTNTNTNTNTNDDDKSNSNTLTRTVPTLRDIDQYTVGRNHNRVQQEDVLCSNGGGSGRHPGNRLFMSIAATHVSRYDPQALLSRPELRARVSIGIIREIPGRFLGKTHHNTLKPLGPRLAVRWVSFVVKTAAQRKVSQEQGE